MDPRHQPPITANDVLVALYGDPIFYLSPYQRTKYYLILRYRGRVSWRLLLERAELETEAQRAMDRKLSLIPPRADFLSTLIKWK